MSVHQSVGQKTVFQRIQRIGTAIADFAHHITPGRSFRSALPLISLLALPAATGSILPACGGGAGGKLDGSVPGMDLGSNKDGNGTHDGSTDGPNNKMHALIAFLGVGANNQWDVFSARPGGTELANLSSNLDDGDLSPSWSSNGNKLAFGGLNLKVRDHQTGSVTPLTSILDGVDHPSFSPDGSRVAYAEAEDGTIRIKIANTDGGGTPTTIYDIPGHLAYSPTWSPDGSRIAFVLYQPGVSYDIVTTDANGGNMMPVLTGNISSASFGGFGALLWTRDGTAIMHTEAGDRSLADNGIFAVLVDPPHTVSGITPNAKKGTRMSESPDGTEIVFSAEFYDWDLGIDRCCDIKFVRRDGTGEDFLIELLNMKNDLSLMRDPALRPIE